jgi:hypothetical protein
MPLEGWREETTDGGGGKFREGPERLEKLERLERI